MEKKLINPNSIKNEELPLIVFSSHSFGFIQWLIKWRTKGQYNHAMLMVNPGAFASQGPVFKEVPMDYYLKKGCRLKFWKIKDITPEERIMIRHSVNKDLRLPWFKRMYDYLGIVGQALGIKKLNNPWRTYCSENARKYLSKVIKGLPPHPSPEELDEIFKTHERLELYGYWLAD